MKDRPHIIVGGGIAAIQLAALLIYEAHNVLIIGGTKPPATLKAAGLINPVTGRSFTRSWEIESLLDHLLPAYKRMEDLFGGRYLFPLEIRRVLNTIQEENKWYSRLQDSRYDRFLDPDFLTSSEACGLKGDSRIVRMREAYRVDLRTLCHDAHHFLSTKGLWENSNFDPMRWNAEKSLYNGLEYDHITFCRGGYEAGEPFSRIKIIPNLGEVLMIRFLDNERRDYAIKKKMFIVPFGKETYWVGGTYTNIGHIKNAEPDFSKLESALEDMLEVPYEIVDRTYGIRPTTPDRKPFIGAHHGYRNVSILNGLGTKGSSLSPYCAQALYDHLYMDKPVPSELAWDRF